MKLINKIIAGFTALADYVKLVFSSSNDASMKRWLAFLSFMYAIRLIESGLRLPADGQAHIMYYVEAFLVLCGAMMGIAGFEKIPSAARFIKTVFSRKETSTTTEEDDKTKNTTQETKEEKTENTEEKLVDITDEIKPVVSPNPKPAPTTLPDTSKLKGKNKELFIRTYYPYAIESQQKTGISADFIIAQKGLETGWKLDPPGWNFGGIKAPKTAPVEKKQLLVTHEVLDSPSVKFPEVLSVQPVENGKYRYKVKDWFRKYDTPAEAFEDHAQFFLRNKRYKQALKVKEDAFKFAEAIAKAGYATNPAYAGKLKKLITEVRKVIRQA